jgi:Flp pilus assembly protein TadG
MDWRATLIRRSFRFGTDGQSLVEFALVVPLLLLLVLGIFEFARAYNAWHVITDAGREGARVAVVADPDVDSAAVVAVIRDALARAHLNDPEADIQVANFRTQTGDPTTVSVSYPYEFVVLHRLVGFSQGLTLSTSTVMRQE